MTPLIMALPPVCQEEKGISRVVEQGHIHVDKVIVCDDGSTDLTHKRAIESEAGVTRHWRSKGYQASLRSLFLRARSFAADAFETEDSDGQSPFNAEIYWEDQLAHNGRNC